MRGLASLGVLAFFFSLSAPAHSILPDYRKMGKSQPTRPVNGVIRPRGGGVGGRISPKLPSTPAQGVICEPKKSILGIAAGAWGSLGVVYILASPIKRLFPVAVLPFQGVASGTSLTWWGWAIYAGWVAFMGYTEGYKAFQCKFSPMVVARASTLQAGPTNFSWWFKALFAPLYSMGLFHASKKRLSVSWGMVFGIAGIVAACKRIPLPWRAVVDGGVVVGLSWGAISVLLLSARSFISGKPPAIDPQMPSKK